ncbi:MAG: transcriptional repressor NrdR [Clostridia bacterium]|nr:transcriptional repressor NrdR [Clostridia bacterium]MCR4907016.1 transcriptional regulator NrdR [Clostridiales bacterium]
MKCPTCGYEDSKVIDSRPVEENNSIKRRRECLSCHARFTTYEIIDQTTPVVLKKDGSRELFDKNKLAAGLYKACEKRPVDAKAVADEIEAMVQGSMKSEITSHRIGEMAMEKLRQLDPVAYVRFASVHREFKDIDTFMREISELKQEEEKNKEE